MSKVRTITKNLAGTEDLLLGKGTVNQARSKGTYPITKLRVPTVVNSFAELNELDPEQFPEAVLVEGGEVTTYEYLNDVWTIATPKTGVHTGLPVLDQLSNPKLKVGDTVITNGYTVEGDGGGATYMVVANGTGTADGGSYIDSLDGSVQLELVEGNISFSARYGIALTESSSQFQKWLDYCANSGKVASVSPFTYDIDKSLKLPSNLTLTGTPGKAVLDGTRCDQVADETALFTNRDGVLYVGDRENISISDLKIIYPSDTAYAGQGLCGAVRFYGGRNCSVTNCEIEPSVFSSSVNLSAMSADNGLNSSGQRTKASNIRVHNNYIKCHSGAFVVKGRNPSGEPNDTRTSDISFIGNTVESTQTTSNVNTTGIVKIDLYSRDVSIVGNNCDGKGFTISFIHCEEGVDNVVINGNTVKNCDGTGIKLFDGQGFVAFNNISVTGNVLDNAGILVSHSGSPDSSNLVVDGNTVMNWSSGSDAGFAALSLQFMQTASNMIVSNNVIIDSEGGIFCRGVANISGNSVRNISGTGISIQDGGYSIIANNRIEESGLSIKLDNSLRVSISSNVIVKTGTGGSSTITQSGSNLGGCIFSNNIVDTTDTTTLTTSGISDTDNVLIGNNLIQGTRNRPQDFEYSGNFIAGTWTP